MVFIFSTGKVRQITVSAEKKIIIWSGAGYGITTYIIIYI